MSEFSLEQWIGKLAVVTGASAGIGKAVCESLVEAGINVVGLARRIEPIIENAKILEDKKGKLYAVRCDITKESDVMAAFVEISIYGPVHILVNNAALMLSGNIYNGDAEKWKTMLETNILGPCMVTREAIRNMQENEIAGQIININSTLGHAVHHIPEINIYPGTKHALRAITEALRLELIEINSNIKVTSLSPGPVGETEFFEVGNLKVGELITNFLKPSYIAETIIFILSTPPNMQVAEILLRPLGQPS